MVKLFAAGCTCGFKSFFYLLWRNAICFGNLILQRLYGTFCSLSVLYASFVGDNCWVQCAISLLNCRLFIVHKCVLENISYLGLIFCESFALVALLNHICNDTKCVSRLSFDLWLNSLLCSNLCLLYRIKNFV